MPEYTGTDARSNLSFRKWTIPGFRYPQVLKRSRWLRLGAVVQLQIDDIAQMEHGDTWHLLREDLRKSRAKGGEVDEYLVRRPSQALLKALSMALMRRA